MNEQLKKFLRPVVYTACESAIACLIAYQSIYEVDWGTFIGGVSIATLLSVLLNLQKLTEAGD